MVDNDDQHLKEAGQENIDKDKAYQTFRYENDIVPEAGITLSIKTTSQCYFDRYPFCLLNFRRLTRLKLTQPGLIRAMHPIFRKELRIQFCTPKYPSRTINKY
ncbi:MAG TPA: hypothetical protein GXZ43_04585 [Clostridiaceae bacterium]|nr:hypothetical protein [Clostridiaceae bacterium]